MLNQHIQWDSEQVNAETKGFHFTVVDVLTFFVEKMLFLQRVPSTVDGISVGE